MEDLKTCSKCKIEKPLKDFYLRGDRDKPVPRSNCKLCVNASGRAYSKSHLAQANKAATRRRHTDRGLTMLWMAKNRAKKKGWEFNIDYSDIYVPEKCPVLGITLEYQIGKASDNSPSLDRIDSSKGYVKGNVIVVSRRANALKNDATLEEMRMIYEFYKACPSFNVQDWLRERKI